jgi:hypothetical protein
MLLQRTKKIAKKKSRRRAIKTKIFSLKIYVVWSPKTLVSIIFVQLGYEIYYSPLPLIITNGKRLWQD